MESSQIFDSSQHAAVSPCGTFIASLTQQNLYIQHAASLAPAYTYPLDLTPTKPAPELQTLQWSASSRYVLLISNQGVHAFSLAKPDLKIQVGNGSGSLGKIVAAEILANPPREQLMVVWEFGRVSWWDLATGRATEMGDVKMGGRGSPWAIRRAAGRPEELALLRRQNAQDVLDLHLPPNSTPLRSITLPTADALSVSWSPDGQWLAVFDSFLGPQQCHIYTADGFPFRQYPPTNQTTSTLPAAETSGLGFRSVTWSTQHVALAETRSLTFLNTRTFSLAFNINLSSIKTETTSLEDGVEAFQEAINAANQRSYTMLTGQLIPVPTAKSAIIDVQFNPSGSFLSCRDASSPETLYLCHMAKRKVHSVLLQHAAIRATRWHPRRETLLMVLGEDGMLYLWDVESGQGPMHVPHGFEKRADATRMDARWVSQSETSSSNAAPEDEKLAILLTTRKAGFQLIWPQGRPDAPPDAMRASVRLGVEDDVDVSQDSLYEILTGRTPLPELRVQQIEREAAAEETERLDDTFREKREQKLAQASAQASATPSAGGIDDDSEIF